MPGMSDGNLSAVQSDAATDTVPESEEKKSILSEPCLPDTRDAQIEPDSLKAKWGRIAGRLKRMDRLVWIIFLVSLAIVVAIQFIPDTAGGINTAWLRSPLEAIFTAFMGALLVLLLFDYYDVSNEFSYLKEIIMELLEMHEATERLDLTVEAALVQGMGANAGAREKDIDTVISDLIKTKYGLSDADADTIEVDSFMSQMNQHFHDFIAKI